jgi:ribosomal protein S18 acetylase RimI-like enzyme
MIIRPATDADILILQQLNHQVFLDNATYDHDLDLTWAVSSSGQEYFTKLVSDPESICLLAVNNTSPIAYIAARHKEISFRLSRYIEIENMGVMPAYQSRGIGHQLVNTCLDLAIDKGYSKVYVTSYYANNRALAFYEREGFSRIDLSLEKAIGNIGIKQVVLPE